MRRFLSLVLAVGLGLPAIWPGSALAESMVMSSVGDAYVSQDEELGTWSIGNSSIVYTVSSGSDGAFGVVSLENPASGQPWEVDPSSDLAFTASGRQVSLGQAGVTLQSVRADEAASGVRLSLVFDIPSAQLRVTRTYACYPQAPVIETWATFEGLTRNAAVPLSEVAVWQLTLPADTVNWITGLKAPVSEGGPFTRRTEGLFPGLRFEIGGTGRSSETELPVFWFDGGAGEFFGGLMWSGEWSLSASKPDAKAAVKLALGSIETTVRGDSAFETPHGFFGITPAGTADVTTALRLFIQQGVREGQSFQPLVTYNTWFAYGNQIDEESMRSEMQYAAALGTELFVVDAGWYPGGREVSDFTTGLGLWEPDTRRFPSGLGALADHARGLGMRFGIWVEPERVDISMVDRSGLARERWLATEGGHYIPGVRQQSATAAQICLGDAEARQWVLERLIQFIDEVRPDYLKWDNNFWINCDRADHDHGSHDGNFAHVRGLYEVLAALRARYPDLLIENCAGGGSRLDLGMLRYTDAAWMDDVTAPSSFVRHNLEGLSAVFPPAYLLSFVVDDLSESIHEPADLALYFRSRMPGILGFTLRGAEFGDAAIDEMRAELDLYKRIRDVQRAATAILLTGQVDQQSAGWDATELISSSTGSAVVLAFRGEAADDTFVVQLEKLDRGALYDVWSVQGGELGRATGEALQDDGLVIDAADASAAHVLLVTKVPPEDTPGRSLIGGSMAPETSAEVSAAQCIAPPRVLGCRRVDRAMTASSCRRHMWALVGYAAIGLLFAWPLPLSLATRLTGPPSGDTGVYVWNLWVFRHELVTHGRFPFFTATIFSLDTTADLSLHNYTVFADLLGLPLLPILGVVTTFNVLYIGITILTAYAMFLLAKEVAGVGVEAWLAGLLFAFSPALISRGTAHFSLVAAAPLPIFVLVLLRLERTARPIYAIAAGAVVAWATLCDPYYGVYCVLLAAWHAGSLLGGVNLAPKGSDERLRGWRRAVSPLIGAVLVVIGALLLTGGMRFQFLGRTVSVMGLHTPVLILTILVVIRLAFRVRVRMTPGGPERLFRLVRLAPYGILSCGLLLSPLLYAVARRIAQGRYVTPQVFWRSSTPGVDLLAFFMPNPHHALFGGPFRNWLAAQNGGVAENVAGVTLVAIVVIALAVRSSGFRLPRYWMGLTLCAASLALGPFVRIGGMNTYLPTPWALLRYAPFVGSARAPARFTVLVMLGVAVLFAMALKAIVAGHPSRRPWILAVAGFALVFELAPLPRSLYSAEIPAIYQQVAEDPRNLRVLELPFGIRDGLSSTGNFSAASQFYQTYHQKQLIGGNLSRVSSHRIAGLKRNPVLHALAILSEGRDLSEDQARRVAREGPLFVERAHLGYVVVDRARARPELALFATKLFGLEKIGESEGRELYRPGLMPPPPGRSPATAQRP